MIGGLRNKTPPNSAKGPAELGKSATRALLWSFGNTALSRLGTLGIGIVLARMLGPDQFGTFAVATVALLAVLSFNELGISLAIVRWRGDPRSIAPTVMTISTVSSFLLFAASYFAAPSFSSAMGDSGATSVVRVMAICIILNGIVAAPAALMQREFMQRERMIIDQVNVWLGAAISVGLAVSGMGAMSLAIGRLVATIVSGGMFLAFAPEGARFGFDRTQLKPLLRFGLPLAGASILVFLAAYADQFVVGSMLGATQLGFYVLAFNLSSWPVSMFSQPLRSVAPAMFARVQDDREILTTTLRSVVGLIAAVTIPVCLAIAGAAGPLIQFVYGNDWAPAASALTWLAIFAVFRILFELIYDYLVVLRHTRPIFIIQIIWLVALVPTLVLGASIAGISGVSSAQVFVAASIVLPLYLHQLHLSGLHAFQVIARLAIPLFAGCVVGSISYLVAKWAESAFVACLIAGLVGIVAISTLLFKDRAELIRMRQLRANGVDA